MKHLQIALLLSTTFSLALTACGDDTDFVPGDRGDSGAGAGAADAADTDASSGDALSVSSSTIALTEATGDDHTKTITISVETAVTADTPLTVTYSVAGKISATGATIASGASSAELTFTALEDADTNDEAVTVTIAASGYTSATIAVDVDDDDLPSLSVTEGGSAIGAAIQITEAAGADHSATVTVSTPAAVSADTALTVTMSPSGALSATINPSIESGSSSTDIVFTAADDANQTNELVTVTITASGYTQAQFQIQLTDDDLPAIVLDTNHLTFQTVEEGHTVRFWLTLDTPPASAVEVTLAADNADVSLSPNPVSLDGSAAVQVTATIAADADDAPDLVRITASAAGYTPLVYDLAITEAGGAAQAFVTSSDLLRVTEGETGSFLVRLTLEPSSEVSAEIVVDTVATAPVSVTPTTLNFTSSNWSTAQTVSVSATQDDDHIGTDNVRPSNPVTLHVQATGVTTADVDVEVMDDESEIWIDDISGDVLEGGGTATFSLAARTAPAAGSPLEVVLTAADQENQPITLSGNGTSSDGGRTLTLSLDSTTQQQITVIGGSSDTAADGTVPITITVGGQTEATRTANFVVPAQQVLVYDAATGGNRVASGQSINLNEDDGTTSYYVALRTAADRTINLSSDNAAVSFLAPSEDPLTSLSFTTANYSTRQEVRVLAPADTDADDEDVVVSFADDATGAGQAASWTMNVHVRDAGESLNFYVPAWTQFILRLQEGGPGQQICFTHAVTTDSATVQLATAGQLSMPTVNFSAGEAEACGTLSAAADSDIDADSLLKNVTFSLMRNGSVIANALLDVQVQDTGLADNVVTLQTATPYGALLWNPYNNRYGMVVDSGNITFLTNTAEGNGMNGLNNSLYLGDASTELADINGTVVSAWKPSAADTAPVLMNLSSSNVLAGLYLTNSGHSAGVTVEAVEPAMAADGRYIYAADNDGRHLYLSGGTALDLDLQAGATDLALVKVGDDYTALWTNGSGVLSCMQITGRTTVVDLSNAASNGVGTVHEYAAVAVGDGLAIVSQESDDGAYKLQTLDADCTGLSTANNIGPTANGDSVQAYHNGSEYLLLFQVNTDLVAYKLQTGSTASTVTITDASRGAAVWAQDRWGVRYLSSGEVNLRTGSIHD